MTRRAPSRMLCLNTETILAALMLLAWTFTGCTANYCTFTTFSQAQIMFLKTLLRLLENDVPAVTMCWQPSCMISVFCSFDGRHAAQN